MAIQRLTDVSCEKVSVPRLYNSFYTDMNWIYGGSLEDAGVPVGSISLWSGAAGVGKSRLVINFLQTFSYYPVIYSAYHCS